ncbi:MAG: aminotransferase class I/II-fold pyridoxal phosphate-dependent enzyme [Blautia sp.]|nr:aminotransferase class I/II-fold pyridoxal phosphate-dependent enzyme [Blautia sp.]MCM1202139.1 aminotransferase class I/II-fold pyridoxal phosphate-dependent enzyme [Bacteroides fragilis]
MNFKMGIHGGDVYRNRVTLDFSVNINPLGMPEPVRAALHRAAEACGRYPDMEAEELKKAVGGMLSVPQDFLLFGNGASELLLAAARGLEPKKTVIPVPSFYGYEYAALAAGSEILYYETRRENGFGIAEDIYGVLAGDAELLFLANPNNPTGVLLRKEKIRELARHCRDRGIYVVLDECFIEFCGNRFSMLPEIREFDNLILVRSFTKSFAIPGARLGYLLCGNRPVLERIAGQLPEWNLSCFAQEAGCACAEQAAFLLETEAYVKKERRFLEDGLRRKGFPVFPSEADFILFYSEEPLYEKLLEKGILIRDCADFRGLGPGFYRAAVRRREDNEKLLASL